MLLNGIRLTGYSSTEDAAQFELAETTVKEVAALDGQLLAVTDDDGTEVEAFVGYSVDYIKREGEIIRMRAVKTMDDTTAAAIEKLTQKVDAASAKAEQSATAATEAKTQADDAKAKADEAKSQAEEAKKAAEQSSTKADGAAASATEAKEQAAEAKSIAEQAGTSPSVRAVSAMYVNATVLTNQQVADVREFIEDFVPGTAYGKGLTRRWDEKYYRMAKDIDAQTSTTYQPGPGMESLYTLIDLAPDGIRIWHQPTCAEDSFTLGEKAHYPDAEGPIYVSKRVGNTSVPGADERWVLES